MTTDYLAAVSKFDLAKTITLFYGKDWITMSRMVMDEIAEAESAEISLKASGKEIVNLQRDYLRALRWFYLTLWDSTSKPELPLHIQEMFAPLLFDLAEKRQFGSDQGNL